MNKTLAAGLLLALTISSCKMENPLLNESTLPYGAPQFDKIENKHYLPAFEATIAKAKAEIDAIVANSAEPDFENTIVALENSGLDFERVAGIFYNLMEADTNDEMQEIAEKITPMTTELSMYSTLNAGLFRKVKAVYEKREELGLEPDQMRLLEDCYRSFTRNGANLSDEDKEIYSKLVEELSLVQLKFKKNVLSATNAYTLNITDSCQLAGLPDYVREMGASAAAEKGLEGWVYDLSYPSYAPFMKFSECRELRKEMYMAYNTKAVGGEFDNCENVRKIIDLRIRIAKLLGYGNYAEYALEERMAKNPATVDAFLEQLLTPSVPAFD